MLLALMLALVANLKQELMTWLCTVTFNNTAPDAADAGSTIAGS